MTLPTTWAGQYFDGHTPIAQLARIEILDGTLTLSLATTKENLKSWPFHELRQTQGRFTGEEVRLERRSSGETLVIQDTAFLAALHQLVPYQVRHFHDPHTRHRRRGFTIGAGIIVLPLLWILYTQGMPALAGPLTHLIPFSWEQKLGNTLLSELTPPGTHCSNPLLQEKVNALVEKLTSPIAGTPHHFHVTIVDQPTINAVALPGGNILLYRGLLEKTDTPEELAGVLAHEIQHILQRHGIRLLIQNLTLGLFIGAITGDVSGILAFVLEGVHKFQEHAYSRSLETEADQKSMALLIKNGINPTGMISLFEYMQRHSNISHDDPLWQFGLTHPLPKDRLASLKNFTYQQKALYRPLFPLDNWKQLVLLCKQDFAQHDSELSP